MRLKFEVFQPDDKEKGILVMAKIIMSEKEAVTSSDDMDYKKTMNILKRDDYPIINEQPVLGERISVYILDGTLIPFLFKKYKKDPFVDLSVLNDLFFKQKLSMSIGTIKNE